MSQPNKYEQQMLDLINADRAEAGLDPLVFNSDLNESSEAHSAWMLQTDTFSHTGASGSSSRERIENAGYELEGNWKTGENIAWVSEEGSNDDLSDEVVRLHNNLMNSPDHRANILNPDFKEIGVGIEVGDLVEDGQAVDAVVVTQNFGTTSANEVILPDTTPGTSEPETETPRPAIEDPSEPPEIVAGTSFDIGAFMASRGFGAPSTQPVTETDNSFMNVEEFTSTSSVEVISVASEIDGPSVDVEGTGNFDGGGTATVEDVTVSDSGSGTGAETEVVQQSEVSPTSPEPAPLTSADADTQGTSLSSLEDMIFDFDEFVFNFGPDATVTSGSTMSRVSTVSNADSENGPSVEVLEMQGNSDTFAAASVDDELTMLSSAGFTSSFEDLAACTSVECLEDFLF